MTNEYNHKSCNVLEKIWYTPLEAAIRWCNLIEHEEEIIRCVGLDCLPSVALFPRWPCLRNNVEKILDAIMNEDLVHGRDGQWVCKGDHVARHRLTVRHADLKKWMSEHYPDQKPAFLFDETERNTHAAINANSFRALQIDRDELKIRIGKCNAAYAELRAQYNELQKTANKQKEKLNSVQLLENKSKITYQNIVAVLLDIITGSSNLVEKHPEFKNETQLVSLISEKYKGFQGLSERTLQAIFAECKKNLLD